VSNERRSGRDFQILDVADRIEAPAVRELLLHVVYQPTPEKLDQVIRRYRESAARLVGAEVAGTLVGGLGFEIVGPDLAVIRHIVVAPETRLQGVGRFMVRWLTALDGVTHLTTETDRDAVDFYRRCGFQITSLGELYPGTERFRCDLETTQGGDTGQRRIPY